MKENFSKCLEKVLVHEGGYINHPEDPGGMTNMGITAQTYAEYTGRRLSTITEREMRSLTVAQIAPIYKRKYWDRCKCDQLPSGIDYAVFDYAVNSGPARAIKHLQQCLAVQDDGLLGPITMKCVLEAVPEELLREYMQRREDFLRGLKTFKTFGKGWISRITEVETKAMQLINLSNAVESTNNVVEPASTIDDETRQRAMGWVKQQS
jgi:lysozyme family protein